jgi:hypothetical protein
MSMSSILARNLVSELRDTVQLKLREHRHEIITGTIMTLISMAIAIAATGNINEVFAPHRGR